MRWMKKSPYPKEADHWKAITYLALDLETTGLDLKKDEIISLGLVDISEGRVLSSGKFYTEIKPDKNPSVASMQVHGLRAVDLADAKSIRQVVPELKDRMKGKVLVAHAAWVERAFLTPHLRGAFPSKVIDTAALARACGYGTDSPNHEPSLEYLARQLNLPVYSPHHALGDALTTAVVFLALATELEKRLKTDKEAMLTGKELIEISVQNQLAK